MFIYVTLLVDVLPSSISMFIILFMAIFFSMFFVHNDACDCFFLLHAYGHNVGCVTITFKYHHYHHLCFYSWHCFPFLYVASTSP
jgi:hypothetical protein